MIRTNGVHFPSQSAGRPTEGAARCATVPRSFFSWSRHPERRACASCGGKGGKSEQRDMQGGKASLPGLWSRALWMTQQPAMLTMPFTSTAFRPAGSGSTRFDVVVFAFRGSLCYGFVLVGRCEPRRPSADRLHHLHHVKRMPASYASWQKLVNITAVWVSVLRSLLCGWLLLWSSRRLLRLPAPEVTCNTRKEMEGRAGCMQLSLLCLKSLARPP